MFLTNSGIAQKAWIFSDSLNEFVVNVDSMQLGGSKGGKGPVIASVEVYAQQDRSKLQTILIEPYIFEHFLDSNTVFGLEDMNFDGFNDFRVLCWTSISLYTSYRYWFYDTIAQQFTRDTSIERYMNPVFDDSSKTFHSFWRIGGTEIGHAIYEWRGKNLSLLTKETVYWNIDKTGAGILITKKRVDGKIQIKESEVYEYFCPHCRKCGLK
ncbi:hypothetical protein GC194_09705 [bacterium]|nr:hypothetical protein [bacterium]